VAAELPETARDSYRYGEGIVKFGWRMLFAATALAATALVHAHHSGAMFDSQKTVTLQGTVKTFQWSNPHCWIQLLVQRDGVTQEWSVEMAATTELYRSGWRPHTLQSGESVTIVVHPMRDGSAGAQFLSAAGPDGAPLGKPKPVNAS
jgi:hypothetical protein